MVKETHKLNTAQLMFASAITGAFASKLLDYMLVVERETTTIPILSYPWEIVLRLVLFAFTMSIVVLVSLALTKKFSIGLD